MIGLHHKKTPECVDIIRHTTIPIPPRGIGIFIDGACLFSEDAVGSSSLSRCLSLEGSGFSFSRDLN